MGFDNSPELEAILGPAPDVIEELEGNVAPDQLNEGAPPDPSIENPPTTLIDSSAFMSRISLAMLGLQPAELMAP